MTATHSLHPTPRWSALLGAQLRLNVRALRTEGLIFLGLWLLFGAIVLRTSVGSRGEYSFHPGLGFPLVAAAVLLPFSVWRGEGPHRRGYHGAMPVDRRVHTLLKVLSGLLLVLAAGTVHVALHLLTVKLFHLIHGTVSSQPLQLWQVVIPPLAAGTTYLGGSAMAVGLQRPWRWVMLVGPLSIMLPNVGRIAGWKWLETLGTTLWSGPHGAATLAGLAADLQWDRWLVTLAIWSGVSISAALIAAMRYADDA